MAGCRLFRLAVPQWPGHSAAGLPVLIETRAQVSRPRLSGARHHKAYAVVKPGVVGNLCWRTRSLDLAQ